MAKVPAVRGRAEKGRLEIPGTPSGRALTGLDDDRPQEVNGYFILHIHRRHTEPLWQFGGVVDLLAPTPKG